MPNLPSILPTCPAPHTGRRTFLFTAVASLAAALAPTRAIAANRPRQRLLLNRCYIAGFRHHAGPRCLPHLTTDSTLLLQAEPAHPEDHFAVRVCWAGQLLGYLPRTDNRHTSRLLRQGARVEARILYADAARPTWEQVCIAVELLA